MATVLHLSWIPLKQDASSDAALESLKGLKEVALSTAGLEHAYYAKGTDTTEPPAIELADVWTSVESAKAAQASPEASKTRELFQQLVDTSNPAVRPRTSLFNLTGDFTKVAGAPIVLISAIFVPSSVSKADFEAAVGEVGKSFGSADGVVASIHGWSLEEIEHPQAGKVLVFLTASGWESEEKAKVVGDAAASSWDAIKKYTEHYTKRFVVFTQIK